ncbi:ferrous iron transport protein B [Maribellus comscasis]|uniref:Ferrous iron transport protein B n=1 Tax=Maribellus comscasis TaxID=2681766 RepID=A0A6I6K1S2_9BACT|nr:ferrous iron transport protein B [Maribellus comscasis]QGY47589.1 ferrous iron transport protein B [Maribellus comscasis]
MRQRKRYRRQIAGNLEVRDKSLSGLKTGESAIITKVHGHGGFRKRITEMGFIKGKKVTVIKNAPLKDPVEYKIMGYNLSLRRSEARMVEVVSESDVENLSEIGFNGITVEEKLNTSARKKGKFINIALVGNPNSGKTTLFNYASGSRERVGNYGGVTVDAKEAVMKKYGYRFNIVDLPGTYSITEYSPEELFVRNHITEKMPDIVVNVVDASNLERNLYLTTQLIDMDIKVVIALNMYDELEKKGVDFDYKALGKMMGIPIIPTIASKGKGIGKLLKKLIDSYEDRDPNIRHAHINYGEMIENGIKNIREKLCENPGLTDKYSPRYIAIKLIETDKTTMRQLTKLPNYEEIEFTANKVVKRLEQEYVEPSETIITDAKYGFITGALKETYREPKQFHGKVRNLDDLFTHKILGFPIFLFFIWLMFQATFTIGSYPMDWIDMGIATLSYWISNIMPGGVLKDLLVDGIIGGVGSVIIFLPNILILFFFISLLEDTGYMARAAFIMDKLMHKIGLHGKSFIPLLMGFGCNVPAIMATRTLENRNDRLLTMLIVPFMSCSARLPVYVLLISAFFPARQGLILFFIYLIGIIIAVIVALVMKKVAFAKKEVPFVMELPLYRIPTLKNTTLHMWHKGREYLKKMGTVILVASILIWALGYFPRNVSYSQDYDSQIAALNNNTELDETARDSQVQQLEILQESERQEQSFIGRLGHAIEPVIEPLGYDWKMGVSILTGLAAKEVVVSSMGVLYNAGMEADETSGALISNLQNQVHQSGKLEGKKVFTPLVAFSFMLFVLIYFPCIAVIAAIKKESNWGWAIFTMLYTTGLAWLVAFAVYQAGNFL